MKAKIVLVPFQLRTIDNDIIDSETVLFNGNWYFLRVNRQDNEKVRLDPIEQRNYESIYMNLADGEFKVLRAKYNKKFFEIIFDDYASSLDLKEGDSVNIEITPVCSECDDLSHNDNECSCWHSNYEHVYKAKVLMPECEVIKYSEKDIKSILDIYSTTGKDLTKALKIFNKSRNLSH